MTTSTKNTAPPPPPPGDEYPLCRQVEEMQGKVWRFDSTTALLTLGTVWGGALLAFAVVDSWGLEGGVPMWARGLLFATLAGWTACFALLRLYPLCWRQVNPAYAALQLEQSQNSAEPSLKNAVLNWLLLWQERRQSVSLRRDARANVVWESLGQHAAAAVRPAVPRELERRYHRWLVALIAICVVMSVYTLVSPKSPFPSVARLLVPIANLLPPQRLYLDVLEPRNAVCFQGEHVTIKVKLSRDPGELPVHIVYSTSDGRYLQQRVPIGGNDGVTFAREFPPSRAGLESSLAYWVECGDSRSEPFQIDVREGVAIEVQSLRVTPPDYTGLEPQTLEGTGNCEGVEGTKLLLESRANTPMQWAWWVPGEVSAPATDKQAMRISTEQPQRATYQWTLKSAGETVYHLAAEDLDGNKSQRPTRYCITTIPDEKPTIAWELPEEAHTDGEISLPLGSTFEATLVAQDPDFALRYVRLHTQRVEPPKTTSLPVRDLLNSPSEGPTNHKGMQRLDVGLQSQPLGMKEGELYEVWGEALDTKLPEANQTESDKLRIRITAPQAEQPTQPTPPQQNNQQQQDNQEQNNQPQDSQKGGEQQSEQQNGEQENSAQQDGENKNGGEQGSEQGNQQGEQQGDKQGGEPGSEQGDSTSGDEGNSENNGNNSGKGGEPSEGGEQGEGGDESEASEGGDDNGASRVDPETQPGDAFDKVLEHLKSERGTPTENDPNRAPDETQQRDDLDPNGKKEPEGSANNEPKPPSKSQQPGEPKTGEPKPGEPKNCPECGAPCESGKCSQCSGGQSSGQSGEQGNSQGESQGSQQSESQNGEQGESQSGEQGNSQGESQNGSQGEPQSSQQSESQNGEQGESQSGEQSNSQGENKPGEKAGDTPGQGGGGERGEAGNAGDESPPLQADDPNLEFTQRQTSLALDYLEKQLAAKEPDPALLKSLGWSRDDLAKFVANWKKMQQAAATGDEKARGDYNELLRSLGIRPPQTASRTRQGHSAASERTTETQSRRIEPPAVLRDRFKNYTERIGQ